jgi:hypothetical protein
MSSAPAERTALSDIIDDNIRTNVRTILARSQIDRPSLYRQLGLSRQSFGNRINGPARFTASEVVQIAYVLKRHGGAVSGRPRYCHGSFGR